MLRTLTQNLVRPRLRMGSLRERRMHRAAFLDLRAVSPDFSPAFEAKRARWYCVLGLRLKTPQTYPLRYVEETDGA